MCERYSWGEKEVDGETIIITVTAKDIYHTEQGKKTQEHCNNDPTEFYGHSAIAFYHGVDPTTIRHRECEDFSTPANFPVELVAAIKAGDMAEFGVTITMVAGLLSPKGQKRYKSKCKADAKRQKADAEWRKAFAEWQKADAEWHKAYAEWQKAYAEWQKAYAKIFWTHFADIKYRAKNWT